MKKLNRSPDDKWIAGICGGLADYTGLDANVIRLVLAICTILGAGSLIIGYVVAWVLLPSPRQQQTAWAQATDRPATPSAP